MLSQGHTVRNIIATILVATGTGLFVCALSGAIQNLLGIMRIISQIAGILAGAALTRAVLIWLSRSARIPIPGWPIIIAGITALVLAIQAVSQGLLSVVGSVDTIDASTSVLDDWCNTVRGKLNL